MQLLQQDDIEDVFGQRNFSLSLPSWRTRKGSMMLQNSSFYCGNCGGRHGSKVTGTRSLEGAPMIFDTIPLFIRMPLEAGEETQFEDLVAGWANEGHGQCLGCDVQHIVFHIGRYTLINKVWTKHLTPSHVQVPSNDVDWTCSSFYVCFEGHHCSSRR